MIRAVQEGPGFSPGLPQLIVLNWERPFLAWLTIAFLIK
ncbi:hypothetical protein CHCC14820_3313 [Bacillus paralicheniformis]|uniref:Uncharacterized protein n=1 Tax=Bacillus paralicheniformis TaxID=1648923 RepID=A0A6I7UHB7_9BACI|nr:hypothetical protein SC10_B2orf03799 [Bacillus paralicheniformis]KFM91220.1 hypothetical protein DJ88_2249 [Bacillus paralicheniformis]OLF90225.1 hypothetical protein B4121_3500 [Bacillus paralicheniformis]OLG07915.1 hypothetical protein B4125_2096 [Bacillus paralicheniformis]OLG10762.1 hypothetical protein B4123_2815 [Bacillus paralicheniformis]